MINGTLDKLEKVWPLGWTLNGMTDTYEANIVPRGRDPRLGVMVRCYSRPNDRLETIYCCDLSLIGEDATRLSRLSHWHAAQQWVTGRNDAGETRPTWRQWMRSQARLARVKAEIFEGAARRRIGGRTTTVNRDKPKESP